MHCQDKLTLTTWLHFYLTFMIICTFVGKGLLKKSSRVYNEEIIYNAACNVFCGAPYKYKKQCRKITILQLTELTHKQNITTPKHKAALTSSSQQTFRILPQSRLALYKLYSLVTNCFCLLKQRHHACCRIRRIMLGTSHRISFLILQTQADSS
jgi:hypothetical protein